MVAALFSSCIATSSCFMSMSATCYMSITRGTAGNAVRLCHTAKRSYVIVAGRVWRPLLELERSPGQPVPIWDPHESRDIYPSTTATADLPYAVSVAHTCIFHPSRFWLYRHLLYLIVIVIMHFYHSCPLSPISPAPSHTSLVYQAGKIAYRCEPREAPVARVSPWPRAGFKRTF